MTGVTSRPGSAARRASRLSDLRAFLHFLIHIAGFLGSTLLLTWGLFALFFLALGGFSFDGLMHQLNNLSSRFVVASPERTASFTHIFAAAHFLLSAGLIVLRREKIVPPAAFEGITDHG